MSESAKSVLALALIICLIATFVSWYDETFHGPTDVTFPLISLLILAVILWALFRRDKAPDFLRKITGGYFERAGLCFSIVPTVRDGCCQLDIYFQNRYERPCRGVIVLQPSVGFVMRRKIESLAIKLECPGAGFGVVHVPWAVPVKYQGKKQSLDVVASVEYPDRRGSMVRFRDGTNVGEADTSAWDGVATMAAAGGGMIVMSRPAKIKFALPIGVAEVIDEDLPIVTEVLWQPGDSLPA